jgi:hypothetical protein
LTGQGWIDVHEIRLAGSDSALDVTWMDQDQWTVTLPLAFGDNPIVLEAYNLRGQRVGTDSITVTATARGPSLQESLRVTEIMYNPPDPTAAERAVNPNWENEDFEFLELTNVSAHDTLDLTGVRITEGPSRPLDLSSSAVTSLAPGQRILVVSNRQAFAARYGTGPTVAGEFPGRLNNGGERITLLDPLNVVIVDFPYGTSPPWPERADGQGASLELIDPIGTPADQLGEATRWRASAASGGSPGTDSAAPVIGDGNGDGRFDQLDIVFALQGAKYLTGEPASWAQGDWNHDGRFDQLDIVAALRAGSYLR